MKTLKPGLWPVAAALCIGGLSALPARAQIATERVAVQVPETMRGAPFDAARFLNVPAGWNASVWARVSGARFIAFAPNGDLLVSEPNLGKVVLLRPGAEGSAPQQFDFATGLRLPHDIVFHTIGATTYIYISETDKIARYTYTPGDTQGQGREVIISNLPNASNPELNGRYGHQLKNIALGPDDKLYVSSASATNSDVSDVVADPPRGAIYQYNADGSGFRVFARGLRNAEGLAFVPGSNDLWAAVNNRDNIKYPYDDSNHWYGAVITPYVDNHPPEEFTHVADGANYGWPYANPNINGGLDDMPFDPDYDNNRDWSAFPQSSFTRISKGIQAHSAPLGLSFTQGTGAASLIGAGALIAYHGSWNRDHATGYKVAFFPWNGGKPGAESDLVSGWLDGDYRGGSAGGEVWGRPVDAAVGARGDLFISDDKSGTIYRVARIRPGAVTGFTLINADTDLPVAGFDPIAPGANIDPVALKVPHLNLRANVEAFGAGSVRFDLDGQTGFHTESSAPFALASDQNGDYAAWPFTEGAHLLSATPFSGGGASGAAGTSAQLSFSIGAPSDATPPTARIIRPLNGGVVASVAALEGSASDAGSGVVSVRVKLERIARNGSATVVAVEREALLSNVTGGVQWRAPLGRAPSEGRYRITAIARDAAGNSNRVYSLFWLDTAPPSLSIETPAPDGSVPGAFTATGLASDTGSSVRQVRLRLERVTSAGTAILGESSATLSSEGAGVRWKLSVPAQRAGAYVLQVTATDAAGHATVRRVGFRVAPVG